MKPCCSVEREDWTLKNHQGRRHPPILIIIISVIATRWEPREHTSSQQPWGLLLSPLKG